MEREIFRRNLKRIREESGLTQRELSERCNYDRTYVGKIERGVKDPSIEAVIRLANALDVDVLRLFEEEHPDEARGMIRELQQSPQKAAETYRQVFSQSGQMMALVNQDGQILNANNALLEFNRSDLDDLVGEPVRSLGMWAEEDTDPDWVTSMVEQATDGNPLVRKTTVYGEDNNELRARVYLNSLKVDALPSRFLLLEVELLDDVADRTMVLQ